MSAWGRKQRQYRLHMGMPGSRLIDTVGLYVDMGAANLGICRLYVDLGVVLP